MRTDDLIGALVADLTPRRASFRRVFAGAIALGAIVAFVAFLFFIGLRPDIGHALESERFRMKFVVTLTLLTAEIGLLSRLSVPGVSTGRWAFAWVAAPALLALAVAAELVVVPSGDWWKNLLGSNARRCLTLIPFLSIGPLVCLLLALRQGAPSDPGLAGAVAGLVAGGAAATLYASHCTDDSPLFVATWYTPAIGLVALAGYVIGTRCLRW